MAGKLSTRIPSPGPWLISRFHLVTFFHTRVWRQGLGRDKRWEARWEEGRRGCNERCERGEKLEGELRWMVDGCFNMQIVLIATKCEGYSVER